MLALVSNSAWITVCLIVILETLGIIIYVIDQKKLIRNYEKGLEESQEKISALCDLLLILKVKKDSAGFKKLVDGFFGKFHNIELILHSLRLEFYKSDLEKLRHLAIVSQYYADIVHLADMAVGAGQNKLWSMAHELKVHEGNIPRRVVDFNRNLRAALERGNLNLLDIGKSEQELNHHLKIITDFLEDELTSRSAGIQMEVGELRKVLIPHVEVKAEPEPAQMV